MGQPATLKLAGRYVGLFPDRLEPTAKGDQPLMPQVDTMSDEELKARLLEAASKL